jgi:hypothetical protein
VFWASGVGGVNQSEALKSKNSVDEVASWARRFTTDVRLKINKCEWFVGLIAGESISASPAARPIKPRRAYTNA